MLQCVAVCCSVLPLLGGMSTVRYVVVCRSVLQCVAVCCSVLQCVAVCGSESVSRAASALSLEHCE